MIPDTTGTVIQIPIALPMTPCGEIHVVDRLFPVRAWNSMGEPLILSDLFQTLITPDQYLKSRQRIGDNGGLLWQFLIPPENDFVPRTTVTYYPDIDMPHTCDCPMPDPLPVGVSYVIRHIP